MSSRPNCGLESPAAGALRFVVLAPLAVAAAVVAHQAVVARKKDRGSDAA